MRILVTTAMFSTVEIRVEPLLEPVLVLPSLDLDPPCLQELQVEVQRFDFHVVGGRCFRCQKEIKRALFSSHEELRTVMVCIFVSRTTVFLSSPINLSQTAEWFSN